MKKILSFVVVFLMIAVPVIAGITVTSNATGGTSQGGSYIINARSTDATETEQIIAAPTTGAIYIKSLFMKTVSPVAVTIGEGETTPGSVDTTVIGPITFGANDNPIYQEFYPALKLSDTTSLVVDASTTADVVIIIQGYIE